MKILLTGKNGQLGYELFRVLPALGEGGAPASSECDLSDAEAIRRWVRAAQPDVIVNAAAYTAVDQAEREPEQAQAVNAVAPGILAEEAARLGALMVHYSTDYVFDGTKVGGAYTEADAPNPLNQYGASKLAGELAVARANPQHLILRTSWVVGSHGNNFLKTMLRLAAEKDQLRVVADQWGAPTSAALLADMTVQLLRHYQQQPQAFPYGLYHLAAGGETNWHEYACYVVEKARDAGKVLRVSAEAIQPIRTDEYPTPARRPLNSRLSTARLQQAFGVRLPDWREGVNGVLEQLL